MNFLKNTILFIALVFISSCIDPVEIENNEAISVLVVEGEITTLDQFHTIKLTQTAKYGNIFDGVIKNVDLADVYLRDDLANVIPYEFQGKGIYVSEYAFAGEVGRSYSIFIKTQEGKEYMSLPEKITPVPQIDSIFYSFDSRPIITETGTSSEITGVEINVKAVDHESQENYYKWEYSGIFRFKSNPELYVPPGSPGIVPKDCCELCFRTETNSEVNIVDDKLFDGNEFIHTPIFIEDNGARFYDKYYIKLKQKSLTSEAYKFYDILKKQLDINGDIFDNPPAEVSGNIVCLTNPQEDVIGFFNASDVKIADLFIEGSDLPVREGPPFIPDDCRTLPNSTTEWPSIWY